MECSPVRACIVFGVESLSGSCRVRFDAHAGVINAIDNANIMFIIFVIFSLIFLSLFFLFSIILEMSSYIYSIPLCCFFIFVDALSFLNLSYVKLFIFRFCKKFLPNCKNDIAL